MIEQDRRVAETMRQEAPRLRNFIRRRVPNEADVEDLVQEVFYELVRAHRLLLPIDAVSGWLFSVARNRITDFFRKKRPEQPGRAADEDGEFRDIVEMLPSHDAGPEAAYARKLLLEELKAALAELPPEQREVFIAHELEGRSFKELAAESGLKMSTLLARKHYAVERMRVRLQRVHDEMKRR